MKNVNFLLIPWGLGRFCYQGVITLPEGIEMCMPGDNVEMTIDMIHPVAMEQGLTFAIREGGRTVGSGRVSSIIE